MSSQAIEAVMNTGMKAGKKISIVRLNNNGSIEHLTLGNLAILIQQFSVYNFNKFTANVIFLLTTMFLDSCQSTLTNSNE